MKRSEKIARQLALQLAIALVYFIAFQMQLAIPGIPGTDFAALIFIPALVRVVATLYAGPSAAIGLFVGSMLVMLQFMPVEPQMLWRGISSATSAPLALMLFCCLGLFPSRGSPLRSDATILFLFIASYAVINAGMHLIGLSVTEDAIGQHLPYFLVMVAGDTIVPLAEFGVYFAVKRLFQLPNPS